MYYSLICIKLCILLFIVYCILLYLCYENLLVLSNIVYCKALWSTCHMIGRVLYINSKLLLLLAKNKLCCNINVSLIHRFLSLLIGRGSSSDVGGTRSTPNCLWFALCDPLRRLQSADAAAPMPNE